MRLLTLLAAASLIHAAEPDFQPLFDGKSLSGWRYVPTQPAGKKKAAANTEPWRVEDGMIVCPNNGGGKLMTEAEFADFVLRLDYRLAPAGNNGVNIRAPFEGRPAYVGMEIQLLDDESEKWKSRITPEQHTGSIYNVLPARTGFSKPVGEWNEMEITARGRRVTVKLNGAIILDNDLDMVKEPKILERHPGLARASGHIGLLGHATRTDFRNIRIRPLR